jgi:cathepsin B
VNGTRPPCQGESHTPKCGKVCTNSGYNVTYTKDKNFGKSVFTYKSESQIQQEIMTNGPVQTAFTVNEDFLSYKSGVYQHKTGNAVGKLVYDLIFFINVRDEEFLC